MPPFLATGQGIQLCSPFRKWVLTPALAAVLAAKDLATAGSTIHVLWIPIIEGQPEYGAVGFESGLHCPPMLATVRTVE